MKKLLDQGDRVPYTIELMPAKNPTKEFSAAVKVIDEPTDEDALKNSFTTIRKIIVYSTDMIKSSPIVLSSIIARLKRYISSDSNHILTVHALKTLIGKIPL